MARAVTAQELRLSRSAIQHFLQGIVASGKVRTRLPYVWKPLPWVWKRLPNAWESFPYVRKCLCWRVIASCAAGEAAALIPEVRSHRFTHCPDPSEIFFRPNEDGCLSLIFEIRENPQ